MEFLLVGAIVGIMLAVALGKVIWLVISHAVDSLFAWAIYTFGNDEAVKRQMEEDARKFRPRS